MIKIYQNNKSRHCEGGTTAAICQLTKRLLRFTRNDGKNRNDKTQNK